LTIFQKSLNNPQNVIFVRFILHFYEQSDDFYNLKKCIPRTVQLVLLDLLELGVELLVNGDVELEVNEEAVEEEAERVEGVEAELRVEHLNLVQNHGHLDVVLMTVLQDLLEVVAAGRDTAPRVVLLLGDESVHSLQHDRDVAI